VAVVFVLIALIVSFAHFRETPPAAPRVVRFSIPPPEKESVVRHAVIISPDGCSVAFHTSAGSMELLWVHSLDSLESRPLPGTADMRGAPFWSADSRSVVFEAQGKLKKIDVSGGPPQTLCDLPGELRGGFWTEDNRIVFGTASSGILQVMAGGGAASPVTIS